MSYLRTIQMFNIGFQLRNWVHSEFTVLTMAALVTLSIPVRSSVTIPNLQNPHLVSSSRSITSPTSTGLTVEEVRVDE